MYVMHMHIIPNLENGRQRLSFNLVQQVIEALLFLISRIVCILEEILFNEI